jgi:hypothetical protein
VIAARPRGRSQAALPMGKTGRRDTIRMERRSKVRYPVEVGVRYRALDLKQRRYITGQTANLSSRGVLVATHYDHQFSAGARVELKIEWPCPLHGTIPLNLVAVGRVVRCWRSSFAVTFISHEFRTVGLPLQRCHEPEPLRAAAGQ